MSNQLPVVKKPRVRSLQSELAAYVPKTELEALKGILEGKISDLEANLEQSAPKEETGPLRVRLEELETKMTGSSSMVDSMRADLTQLQGRLADSTSRSESEAKVKEVERDLSDARRGLELARATIAGLEEKFSQSSARIEELHHEASSLVQRTELETTRDMLQSKITGLEERLFSSVLRSEADELRDRVAQLEGELSVSKANADTLFDKANRLEVALTEVRENLNSVEMRGRDLESRLSRSEVRVVKEKLARAPRRLLNYIKAWLSLYVFYYDLIRGGIETLAANLE